jgi:hypothetical protein
MQELSTSLAAAMAELPAIPRNKTVQVRTKTGGSYSFSYAPLDTIVGLVRPILARHGLFVLQTIDAGIVSTIIGHSSGQSLTLAPVKIDAVDGSPQAIGSALTYARRYSYTLALCLSADDDDDGGAAAGNETKTVREKPVPADPWTPAASSAAAQAASDGKYADWWKSQSPEFRAAAINTKQHIDFKAAA